MKDTFTLVEDVVLQYENGTSYNAARAGQEVSVEQAAAWGLLDAVPLADEPEPEAPAAAEDEVPSEPEPAPAPEPEPAKPTRSRAKKDEDA